MKLRILLFSLLLFPGGLFYSYNQLRAQSKLQKDTGYFFVGSREVIKTKKIKADVFLTAFTRKGVIISEKEGSNGPGTFELVQGTGKWAGIVGNGTITEKRAERVDEYSMPGYEISWDIDPVNAPNSNENKDKDKYEYRDECLSFHGPHVFLFSKELSNGISLELSTQSGVLMSMLDPDTPSPRNNATCFDRGNTVKLNGKTLGDVMLLEDTDEDGDVVWLLHIWWYNKGPGSYKFIDGIGKWEGIEGVGVTRGNYKNRSDDHFMLKSELVWNLK